MKLNFAHFKRTIIGQHVSFNELINIEITSGIQALKLIATLSILFLTVARFNVVSKRSWHKFLGQGTNIKVSAFKLELMMIVGVSDFDIIGEVNNIDKTLNVRNVVVQKIDACIWLDVCLSAKIWSSFSDEFGKFCMSNEFYFLAVRVRIWSGGFVNFEHFTGTANFVVLFEFVLMSRWQLKNPIEWRRMLAITSTLVPFDRFQHWQQLVWRLKWNQV